MKRMLSKSVLMAIVVAAFARTQVMLAQPRVSSTDLGTLPGGDISVAFAINDRGQVVGYGNMGSDPRYHWFFWHDGTMIDLAPLGSDYEYGIHINARGQVAATSGSTSRAFLWHDGVMTDLGTLPGWIDSSATGINNRG